MADIVPPAFAEWFAKNYPCDTIIFDPAWHVGPIFRAACWHYNDALSAGKDAEIERLRAALEKISTWPDHRLPSPRDIARAALEKK
jgi:hypothetical protein